MFHSHREIYNCMLARSMVILLAKNCIIFVLYLYIDNKNLNPEEKLR